MADLARRGRSSLESTGRGALKRSRQQDRGPLTEYLAFCLGTDVYASPVSVVREILKPPPLTPVPRAPPAVMGIVSVRGQLVTVIDLRRRLMLAEGPFTRRTRILLVESPKVETLGLYVDEVLQVVRLADAEIEPAAAALGTEVGEYITGIARPGRAAAPQAKLGSATSAEITDPAALLILLDLRAVLAT